MKKQPEYNLQVLVCKYLDLKYPNVNYLSDTVAQISLTIPQQVRNKKIQKQGFKCPDLLILKANDKYNGLFIELKAESPYYKNNPTKLKSNEHIELQAKSMDDLRKEGYYCTFSWTFEMTKEIIDKYLENQL